MIFVTTHIYALGKELGVDDALREFDRQLQDPTSESLAVVRTITRLRMLGDVQLWIDPGSSRIAESRCRAFHEAFNSEADVWFSCDDDCEASVDTLRWMVEAVSDGVPSICSAPYWTRLHSSQEERISIQIEPLAAGELPAYRDLASGGRVMPMRFGGFGLVTMNRSGMTHLANMRSFCVDSYTDKLGIERLAPFIEYINSEGTWLGEDLAFFTRLPPTVRREALVTGMTRHAGKLLDLRLMNNGPATLEQIHDPDDSAR